MAYPERIRKWWLRVSGDGDIQKAHCQVETYSEKKGFVECGRRDNLQVHHLYPEAEAIENGDNPDFSIGLVACALHHVGRQRDEDNLPFTGQFTFHPDIGEAQVLYRAGDHEAYKKAMEKHQEAARRGERCRGGDWGSDEYYTDKQTVRASKYQQKHPEDLLPVVNHQKPKEHKKRHWYDIV